MGLSSDIAIDAIEGETRSQDRADSTSTDDHLTRLCATHFEAIDWACMASLKDLSYSVTTSVKSTTTVKQPVIEFLHDLLDETCGGLDRQIQTRYDLIVPSWPRLYVLLFKLCAGTECRRNQIQHLLVDQGFSKDLSASIGLVFALRYEDLRQMLIRSAILLSCARMDDYDYKVSRVTSSSTMANMDMYLFTLTIYLTLMSGKQEKINVEFTTDELDQVLAEFSKIEHV